jgi:hypothetical protein
MPNVSLARSKSASDLARFRDLVTAAKKAGVGRDIAYYNAAMAMILTKRIYFVQEA